MVGRKQESGDNARGKDERIRIDDDRVEVEGEEFKVRIDTKKDGETRARVENSSRHEDGDANSEQAREQDRDRVNENTDTSIVPSTFRFEAEADVFTDTTIVKVEINGIKNEFETTADTREAVAAEIAELYGLSTAVVDDVLDFQIENRASQPKDQVDTTDSGRHFDDDDDDENEHEEEFEDEDEDNDRGHYEDDHRGRGGNDDHEEGDEDEDDD